MIKKKIFITIGLIALSIASIAFATTNLVQNSHEHTYSNIWEYDNNMHWHSSTCEHTLVRDQGEHNFSSWIIVKEATSTEDGLEERKCTICNYKESKKIELLNGYTVTWTNFDDSILEIDDYVRKGDMPNYNSVTPTKPSDSTYSYTFIGWDKELTKVTNDVIYKAVYKKEFINYTVKFVNDDDSVILEKTYHYNDEIEVPNNPTKESDKTFNYNFLSWDKTLNNATSDITYKAIYSKSYINYIVKFVNDDNTNILISSYHYGDEVVLPTSPTKSSDNTYNYTFSGWDKEVTKVTNNVTYVAKYNSSYINYTIKFVNYDNSIIEIKDNYHYGDSIVFPSNPTKEEDNTFVYNFLSWDNEETIVSGNATYKAIYDKTYKNYKIVFINGTNEETFYYHYGDAVDIPNNPVKDDDKAFTYTFIGWNKKIENVTSDATYIALYQRNYINYLVTFISEDVILSTTTYHYGENIIFPSNPKKSSNETYDYKFIGWDNLETKVTSNLTYNAKFEEVYRSYTIKFINDDNSIISEKTYHYGDIVEVPIATKTSDKKYNYIFTKWNDEVTTCKGDKTYKAIYDKTNVQYEIKFLNEDGTLISENNYNYGDTIIKPDTPLKESDNTYNYTFSGWNQPITNVTEDKIYIANYTASYINYTIEFINYDNKVISSKTYHYGDSIEVPLAPTKPSDNTYNYEFIGWDKEVNSFVTSNVTYIAEYSSSYINYIVKFLNEDNTLLAIKSYHYGDMVQDIDHPTKKVDEKFIYTFSAWDKDLCKVTSDLIFIAKYNETPIDYTITFLNDDSSVISSEIYHYGDSIEVPSNPTKLSDNTYYYTFNGWDKEVNIVTSNATYIATYIESYIEYTIKFLNDDNSEISNNTYHYGESIKVPSSPIKSSDNIYNYTFNGWDKNISVVKGSVTYKATYTKSYIDYTIKFVNDDNSEISTKTYHYNEEVIVPPTPNKASDETYNYTFVSWDKEVKPVTESVTYKAVYAKSNAKYTVIFKDYDDTILDTQEVIVGSKPIKPIDPVRDSDNTYNYEFIGWEISTDTKTDNIIYTAKYKESYIDYTITFINDDGSVISTKTYHYKDIVEVPIATKASDSTYNYTFDSWDKEVISVIKSVTYKATYTKSYIEYTITFVNDDESVISTDTYHYDEEVKIPSKPTKESDGTYNYTFVGWDKEVKRVTENTTYKAIYSKSKAKYNVTFKDYDGTIIKEMEVNVEETATKPTDPIRNSDNTYTYTFSGWEVSIDSENYNVIYIATYTKTYIDYTITFINNDDSVISTKTYHYKDIVEVPIATKSSDNTYNYSFSGWDKEVTSVTKSVTYKATYTKSYIEYTITFVNDDESVISTKTYHYKDIVEVPTDPIKESDGTYNYTFVRWDKEVTSVTNNVTYKAIYSKTNAKYTVIFKDYDGTIIEEMEVNVGETATKPTDPIRNSDNTYTYTFSGWEVSIDSKTDNVICNAIYKATYIDYTITFVNDDESIISTKTYHYGDIVEVPIATKANDNTYNYSFSGWDKEVTSVTKSVTYKATYTKSYIEYTITFVNDDESVISTKTYHYKDIVEVPSTPTKESDETYNYTFVRWDKEVTSVTNNVTYKAIYSKTNAKYTVIFKDYDGKGIDIVEVKVGEEPTKPTDPVRISDNTYNYAFSGWTISIDSATDNVIYTATYTKTYIDYTITFVNDDESIISTKTYHYGDSVEVPSNPTKESDNIYNYSFSGWDKEVTRVTNDATYKATYLKSYIDYTITFVNDDESVLSTKTYHYGDKVEVPSNPTKVSDNTYTYSFSGWDKEVTQVTSEATYKATYTKSYIDYTITFVNDDGSVISIKSYHYGDSVEVPSNPTKASDNTYNYSFNGWDKEVTSVTSEATYQATYSKSYIEYTIAFINIDNTAISIVSYHYGDIVNIPSEPKKASDKIYEYTFSGWDKDVTIVTCNDVYTATYKAEYINYEVIFVNDDGTILNKSYYHYGDVINAFALPTKSSDNTYIYTFNGWDKDVTLVEDNAIYVATYIATYIDYTITFVSDDESIISTKTYHYGDSVEVPSNPTKESDSTYTYSFSGWDKEVTSVTSDAIYKATYSKFYIDYTITFVNDDESIILAKTYHYGDTVDVPSTPNKASDNTYTYSFSGWDKEVTTVKNDATYQATYTKSYIDYTITFVNEDGSVLSTKTYHYGDTVEVPSNPTKASDNTYNYSFNGWDKEVTSVTSEATYKATYTKSYIDYIITFVNDDGSILSTKKYHYGDTVEIPSNPTKLSDNTYNYSFNGWNKEVTSVTSDATYQATYTKSYIDYIITFVNDDGSILSIRSYHYNEEVIEPFASKASDGTYNYTFIGWDKEVTNALCDATYKAVYSKTNIKYNVIFKDYDGKIIEQVEVNVGETAIKPSNPFRNSDNTYNYEFSGWTVITDASSSDLIYQATYIATYIDYLITFINDDGSVILSKTYHYKDTVEIPTPIKLSDNTYNYTFSGWDKEVTSVTNEATYKATYLKSYIEYNITFINDDESVILTKTYHYGDIVEIPTPTKASDNTYNYIFCGWDKEVTQVISNAIYKATYEKEEISYQVIINHYLENLDNSYSLFESIKQYGSFDSIVLGNVNNYDGFTSPEVKQITITNEGTLSIDYYYIRNSYKLNIIRNDGTTQEEKLKYEQIILDNIIINREDYTIGGLFSDEKLTKEITIMPNCDTTVYVWWAEETKTSNFTYSGTDEITINKYNGNELDVVIPMYIGNKEIKNIGSNAFNNKKVTNLVIPDTVETIGYQAFYYCTNLSNLVLSSNLKTIEGSAFWKCSALTDLTLPSSLTSIGKRAFSYCSNLTNLVIKCNIEDGSSSEGLYYNSFVPMTPIKNVIIADGVTKIGDYAFQSCSTLESISLPTTLETIGKAAFYSCTSIKELELPSSLNSIGELSFYRCSALEELIIGCEIESPSTSTDGLYYKCFPLCKSLKNVIIKEGVLTIGDYAFNDCSSITNLTLPSTITYIGQWAFGECTGLTSLNLPKNVQAIGSFAFYKCSNIKSINLSEELVTISSYAFGSCSKITSINIPDKVTSISNSAFTGCSSVTSIYLGKSLVSIESNAFDGVTNLTDLIVNTNYSGNTHYESLYYRNFSRCTNLINLTIGDDVTEIRPYEFSYASTIQNITIGKNVKTIGKDAFVNCSSVKKINIKCNIDSATEQNGFYKTYFSSSSNLEEVVFSDDVTSIGSFAFNGATSIKNIIIGANVTSIGEGAFMGCSSINNITIPDNVKTIESKVFKDCTNLNTIDLNNVTEIGSYTFSGCTLLTSINISNLVSSIEEYAFNDCTSLDNVTLPNGLTKIEEGLFKNCQNLSDIVIPDTVTIIDSYAFYGCLALQNISIPDSVLNVNNSAFMNCNNIVSLKIGNGVLNIASNAFNNCSKMETLVLGKMIESIDSSSFTDCISLKDITINCELKDGKNSTDGFYNKYFKDSSKLENITIDCNATNIPNYAFDNCISLQKVTILSNLLTIGKYAFNNCQSLNLINIPLTVNTISEYAFNNCLALKEINLPTMLNIIENNTFSNCKLIEKVIIPDNVTEIKDQAFLNCSSINRLYLGKSITSVSNSSFEGCSGIIDLEINFNIWDTSENSGFYLDKLSSANIKYITIGNDVTSIGYYAFLDASSIEKVYYKGTLDKWVSIEFGNYAANPTHISKNLYILDSEGKEIFNDNTYSLVEEVKLSENVSKIPHAAFINLVDVKTVELPKTISYIGSSAFLGCVNLKKTYFDGTIDNWINIEFYDMDSNPIGCSNNLYILDSNGNELFNNNSYSLVTDLNISDNVTIIKNYAFLKLKTLKTVIIPSSVETIGFYAFFENTYLNSVTLNEGLKKIRCYSFARCYSLTSIELPSSLETIELVSFDKCYSLVEVINKSNLTLTIGSEKNGGVACYALRVINNRDFSYITKVGDYVFYIINEKYYLIKYIGSNDSLILPSSCHNLEYEIYKYAFYNLDNIKFVSMPDFITKIDEYTFANCTNLVEAKLSDGVKIINDNAFLNCINLQSILLGTDIETISTSAFKGCTEIQFLGIKHNIASSTSSSEGFINKYFNDSNKIKEIYIDDNCTIIGSYAFSGLKTLETITFSNNLITIENNAFENCSSLTEIVIPDSTIKIGDNAFNNCSNVNYIKLGTGLSSLGAQAFYGCTNLATLEINSNINQTDNGLFNSCFKDSTKIINVIIGENVTLFNNDDFKDCNSIQNVYYKETTNKWAQISFNNIYANPLCNGANLYESNIYSMESFYDNNYSLVTSLFIESSEIIKPYAFINCKNLENLKTGDTVKKIGSYAFYNCVDLKSIIISDNLILIGTYAFYNCNNLENVYLGSNVFIESSFTFKKCPNIEILEVNGLITNFNEDDSGFINYYFKDSKSIVSILLKGNIEMIGVNAFNDCTTLQNVIYEGSVNDWVTIDFKNEKSNPLYYATSLYCLDDSGEIIINNSYYSLVTSFISNVSSINNYAFYNYSKLTSVKISDNVTSIGDYAFYKCNNINYLYLGKGITSIPDTSFELCTNLNTLEINCNIWDVSIEDDGFIDKYFCDTLKLEYIIIGEDVTSIGTYAFYCCNNIKKVYYKGTINDWINIDFKNEYSNVMYYTNDLYYLDDNGKETFNNKNYSLLTEAIIDDSNTSISSYSFINSCSLELIYIPKNIKSIGASAFKNCSNLYTLYYGGTINDWLSINFNNDYSRPNINYSFEYFYVQDNLGSITFNDKFYSLLTTITIPDTITSIDNYAFANCYYLEEVIAHNNLKKIGNHAFYNCHNLKSIDLKNTKVSRIEDYAFANCDALSSVTFSDNLLLLSSNTFENCYNLVFLVIPDNVVLLEMDVFKNCTSLRQIIIPKNIFSINLNIFDGCTNLETILYKGSYEEFIQISGYDNIDINCVYYYSEEKPTVDGLYWHYINDVPFTW